MEKKVSNKGRITRVDQAWAAAHREKEQRETKAEAVEIIKDRPSRRLRLVMAQRIEDPELAWIDAHRIQDADEAHEDALRQLPVPASEEAVAAPARQGHMIALPLRLIAAAMICAASKDVRYYLNGVYIHGVDGELRICATDGHRLVVSRHVLPDGEKLPQWADAGVILPREDLAQALPVLAKNGTFAAGHFGKDTNAELLLEYETGRPKVVLHCANRFASFAMQPIDGKYPDYAKVLAAAAVNLARGDNEAMKVSGLATQYVKGAAEIAAKMGAKAIHAFINGSHQSATFFTFDGAPDTAYIVMPMQTDQPVSDGVVRMVGRDGIAASLAAFRAHLTRTTKAIASTKNEKEIAELEERRTGLEAKIAHLINVTTPAHKQLTHNAA